MSNIRQTRFFYEAIARAVNPPTQFCGRLASGDRLPVRQRKDRFASFVQDNEPPMDDVFAPLSSLPYLLAGAHDRYPFYRFQISQILPLFVLEEVIAIQYVEEIGWHRKRIAQKISQFRPIPDKSQ
jgi:hypothetical protein